MDFDKEHLQDLAELVKDETWFAVGDLIEVTDQNANTWKFYDNTRNFIAYATPARVLALLAENARSPAGCRIKVDYAELFGKHGWLEVFAQEFAIAGVTDHRFAVHNSVVSMGMYTATHIGTGFAMSHASTPDEAIAAASEKWLSSSPEELALKMIRAKNMTGIGGERIIIDEHDTDSILPSDPAIETAKSPDWQAYHSALSQCAELLDNMADEAPLVDTPSYLAAKLATPAAAAPQQAVPEGWKPVFVNDAFDDLMYWLERSNDKGNLNDDLIGPLEKFDYQYAESAAAPVAAIEQPPADELRATLIELTSVQRKLIDANAEIAALTLAAAPSSTDASAQAAPYEPTYEMLDAARQRDPAASFEQLRLIWWAMWKAMPAQAAPDAVRDMLAERRRQVADEGWTPEHDDAHDDHSLARAAAAYAVAAAAERADRAVMDNFGNGGLTAEIKKLWPATWSIDWLKPKSRRTDLVKAGALVLAEIERLDRAALRTQPPADSQHKG